MLWNEVVPWLSLVHGDLCLFVSLLNLVQKGFNHNRIGYQVMESKIVLRVLKEIQEVNEGDDQLKDQIYLQAVDDADIRKVEGFIRGPPDTPYENGIFHLSIRLPNEYPFKPPQVTFVTKIYHPNIRTTGGYICLDVLAQAWSPTMTLKSMLLSLQLLLQDPKT